MFNLNVFYAIGIVKNLNKNVSMVNIDKYSYFYTKYKIKTKLFFKKI